jgi:hypothetical protein
MAPEGWGARLMTCICAATRLAASGSAEMYFIMTKVLVVERAKDRNVCTADKSTKLGKVKNKRQKGTV